MPSPRLRDLALIAVPFFLLNLWFVLRSDEPPAAPEGPHVVSFKTGPWDATGDRDAAVDPGTVQRLVLRFDRPMVHSDRFGRTSHAGELTTEPSVDGALRWEDERTLVLEADSRFPAGVDFVATLAEGLADREGRPVEGEREFAFDTGSLVVRDVRSLGFDGAGNPEFEARFSLPVAPGEFARHVTLRGADEPTPVQVRTLAARHRIRFRASAPGRGDYEIRIGEGLCAAGGTRPLGRTFTRTVTAAEELDPWIRGPVRESPDRVVLSYQFDHEVERAEFRRHLSIEPPLPVTYEGRGRAHRIAGSFERGRRYVVTLKKGLRGGPALLPDDERRVFHPPDRDAMVRLVTLGGRYLGGQGARALELHSVNVPEVVLIVDRIEPSNIVHRVTRVARYGELTSRLIHRKISLSGRLDEDLVTRLDLRKLLGAEARGILRVTVREESSWRSERATVVVSDLGLTLDLGERQATVRVASLRDTKPVVGVRVRLLDELGIGVAEGVTEADGTAVLPRARFAPGRTPLVLVAEKGDDASYLALEDARVDRKGLPIDGRPWLDALAASVHVERGIYRPGDRVLVKAYLRAPGVVVPGDLPIGLRLVRPDGRPLAESVVRTGDRGSVAAELTTPSWGPTGPWTVEVGIPGGMRLGEEGIRVEDFLPDRMRVTAETPRGDWTAGDEVEIAVTARMLAGPAAAGCPVSGSLRGTPTSFRPSGAEGFRFGDEDDPGDRFNVAIDETRLDRDGAAGLTVALPDAGGSRPYRTVVTVSVQEPGGRAVSSHVARTLHPCPVYLGLRDAGRTPDGARRLEVAAVRPDGSPADLAEVRLTLHAIHWNSWWDRRSDGSWRYRRDRNLARLREISVSLAHGRGFATVRPPDGRDVFVRVSARGAGSATHVLENATRRPATRAARLDLALDRRAYAPGDEVVVSVTSPHPGRLLWQLQDADVLTRGEQILAGVVGEIRLRIPDTDAPGLHLVASVLRAVEPGTVGVPRAEGVVAVPLHRERLTLETACVEEIRAGSELIVDVIVRGPDGPLANADVCVALVDEGILALTGHEARDPGDVFLGPRRCGTVRYDLYGRLLPSLVHPEDSESGGGGYPEGGAEALRLNPVRARRVEPLVDWHPSVTTDAQGRATVRFVLPDRTGAARVTVLAAHGRRFGLDAVSVRLTRPVDVHAAWPRFLAPGDVIDVPISVTNSTTVAGEARLVLSIEGPAELVRAPRPVRVGPGEQAVATARLRAGSAGVVRIATRVDLGSDTATERAEFPVRPAAPRTRAGGTARIGPGRSFEVSSDAAWLEGTRRGGIVVSRSPLARLSGGLDHLLRYPYGCCEQTVSTAFPLLRLADVARAADETLDEARIATHVQTAIDRVLTMQIRDGGLALWTGSRRYHGWASCYGAHFLLEAKRAGYDVPDRDLRRLIDWLPNASDYGEGIGVDVYAAYVRTLAGRRDVATLDRLAAQAAGMRPWERAMLLAAGARTGTLDALAPRDPSAEIGDAAPMDSETRALAIRLLALLDRTPDDDAVPTLVDELFARQTDGRWGTTQENAFALLALGRACETADGSGTLTVNGEDRALGGTAAIRLPDAVDPVTLTWSGPGSAWVSWHTEGVRTDAPPTLEDRGLRVRRRYTDLDGEPRDVGTFRRGELIVVELTLSAPKKAVDLVLVDPLPACLEIENPAVRTRARSGWLTRRDVDVDRFEIRDDRYLLFCSLDDDKPRVWRYLTRCTAAGTFAVPPVSLEAMYDPKLRSVSGGGTCEVAP